MAGVIETEIPGEPAAFRGLADYLRSVLAARAEELADRTAGQRSLLAGTWLGAAADAFGDRAGALVSAGDGLADQARAAAAEVEALGETLRLAQEGMAAVRSAAASGGLSVTGTMISWPADVWQLDLAEAIRFREVWDAALADAESHRRSWYAALDRAAAFVEAESSTLLTLTADLITTAAEQALLLKASRIMTGQAEFFESEVRRLDSQIDDLSRTIERFGRPGDRALLEKLAQERIDNRYAAAAARDAAQHPELPRELRGGFGLLNGALAGYGVYADIQDGESTQQAVVSQGVGLLAGAGTAAAIGAGAGSWLPGPGTLAGAVIGGGTVLVGGAVASWLGDKGVDYAYEHDDPDGAGAEEPEPDPGAELLGYAAQALASPHPATRGEAR